MRSPVIGVMGASNPTTDGLADARELGRLIAQRGWTVLTGGCNYGVENAAAEGAQSAGGTAIGILPDRDDSRASPHLSYAIMTGVGEARNLINVMSSDVVVACPGDLGTLSEVVFALKNEKRVILLAGSSNTLYSSHSLKAGHFVRSNHQPLRSNTSPQRLTNRASATKLPNKGSDETHGQSKHHLSVHSRAETGRYH